MKELDAIDRLLSSLNDTLNADCALWVVNNYDEGCPQHPCIDRAERPLYLSLLEARVRLEAARDSLVNV